MIRRGDSFSFLFLDISDPLLGRYVCRLFSNAAGISINPSLGDGRWRNCLSSGSLCFRFVKSFSCAISSVWSSVLPASSGTPKQFQKPFWVATNSRATSTLRGTFASEIRDLLLKFLIYVPAATQPLPVRELDGSVRDLPTVLESQKQYANPEVNIQPH
jgi:hypothetical protein